MIRASTIAISLPRPGVQRAREKLISPVPSKPSDAIEEAVALHKREARLNQAKDALEASFRTGSGLQF